jgi:hypothetical protein
MRRLAHAAVIALAVLIAAAALLGVESASAQSAYASPYSFEQTFGTALRLLRVDLGVKITERDVEGGYLLFEYTSPESGRRVSSGSIEVVRGRDSVSVTVQLPALPSYHEQMILDALVKKLVVEHGEPPKKARPAPDKADAGPD